jgi:hypothetical protein
MAVIKVHYKYRFDPQGISDQERKQLKEKVKKWLLEHV